MRRGLASLIIGLSLLIASAAWAGFVLSNTLLDPGRSERLADQLLDNPEVRQALVTRLAGTLEDQIPPEIPIRDQVLEAGAAQALDDPRVEALIRDGFVRVHRNALEGNAEPVVIDAGALGAAGRDALVEARPELAEVLPPSPVVELELPTTGLSWIGSVKNIVDRYTRLAALLALAGATLAFAVASNRGVVLVRVAFWGYGASAFWLLMGYGIPWLAARLSPTSAAIVGAIVDVYFGAMIPPAVAMAVIATGLLVLGLLLPILARRRGAGALQRRRPRGSVPGVASRPPRAATGTGARAGARTGARTAGGATNGAGAAATSAATAATAGATAAGIDSASEPIGSTINGDAGPGSNFTAPGDGYGGLARPVEPVAVQISFDDGASAPASENGGTRSIADPASVLWPDEDEPVARDWDWGDGYSANR